VLPFEPEESKDFFGKQVFLAMEHRKTQSFPEPHPMCGRKDTIWSPSKYSFLGYFLSMVAAQLQFSSTVSQTASLINHSALYLVRYEWVFTGWKPFTFHTSERASAFPPWALNTGLILLGEVRVRWLFSSPRCIIRVRHLSLGL
jgi:hypothetical protein